MSDIDNAIERKLPVVSEYYVPMVGNNWVGSSLVDLTCMGNLKRTFDDN